MLFEHPETGLRVRVTETVNTITAKSCAGESFEVDVERELTTDAGQSCIPWSDDDYHQLMQIGVMTHLAMVRMVRAD